MNKIGCSLARHSHLHDFGGKFMYVGVHDYVIVSFLLSLIIGIGRMLVCVCKCVCVCVYMCVCLYAHVRVCLCVHACMHRHRDSAILSISPTCGCVRVREGVYEKGTGVFPNSF